MPSPPVLEFDELLKPISDEQPGGSSMPFMLRQELDDARKEESPDDYDADDPQRPDQATMADWPAIVKKASEGLKSTGKDLQIAARLTEALTKIHGFAGLRDGFQLMHQMMEQMWDHLKPEIESEDDLEIRAAPFNWLDDPDRGAFFPLTIRQIPLIVGDQGYSWQMWHDAQSGHGDMSMEAFERAITETSHAQCQNVADDIAQSAEAMNAILDFMGERLGQVAPALSAVRPAIQDCQTLMQQIIERKGPVASDEPDSDGEEGATDGSGEGAPKKPRGHSREEIYQTLAQAAAQLRRIEPHSPIPYLIQKAVSLGAMPFPELMKALIRDDNVLNEMNREIGVKDDPPDEQ